LLAMGQYLESPSRPSTSARLSGWTCLLGDAGMNLLEQAGYFEVSGAHLYTVLHGVADPVARVLLVGPFASERHRSYIPWVRWARYLAARRIECLRYDYRGIGESTGAFEDMSFENWIEDVELLAGWLKARSPDLPFALHGLELGALLAAKTFETGVGDALLLWAPPASANQALRATLLRCIGMDNMFKYGDERKLVSDYLRQLESGHSIEVDGYHWSAKLWHDSLSFELPVGMESESTAASACNRPVRTVNLDRHAAPLIKGSSVGYEALHKDFGGMFADNIEWIVKALAIPREATVNGAIETRELITVEVDGTCLRGTYHRSHGSRSGPQAGLGTENCIGVMFLNHGFLPRTAPGDSAVYWADSFAKSGYPCFRFDLPGLGDSGGDVPTHMLDFVNGGGYATILSATLKELVERFSLSGFVIVGHCAGAVTALYTAAVSEECRGVVLTDPYFYLTRESANGRKLRLREIMLGIELSQWASWSRLGALASDIYYRLKYIRLLVRRNKPPRNANLPLLRCWNAVASAGMPILIMKAPVLEGRGIKPSVGEFDYLDHLQVLSGRRSNITVKFVEGTNHAFADDVGKAAIRQNTEQWLKTCFPTIGATNHPDLESCPVPLRGGRSVDRLNTI
jgi:alpha-beta hydrolase superfamily lysophospholipase